MTTSLRVYVYVRVNEGEGEPGNMRPAVLTMNSFDEPKDLDGHAFGVSCDSCLSGSIGDNRV